MDPRVIYETWAPPTGRWSPWAKPVLFAHLREADLLPPVEVPTVRLEREPGRDTALVLELPGLESISMGLDLARLGFRPVPLFNACPIPPHQGPALLEVVPATPLLAALLHGTEQLRAVDLSPAAPPAFLLDALRHGVGPPAGPGRFDNRWVVFSTDFPSANFLMSQGVTGVQLVHRGPLLDDLLDIVRAWRRQGLALSHIDLNSSLAPTPLTVPPVWWAWIYRLARRLWALVSLRRNPQGGFGRFVAEAEAGG